MNELILISAIWALAVALYYFAGKKHGYYKGYMDGHVRGSNDVFSIMVQYSQSNDEVTK